MNWPSPLSKESQTTFGDEDLRIIRTVELFLADAIRLKKWWMQADASQSYAQRFELERTFNRPDYSYGFFDSVQLSRGLTPVMGSVQHMLFDQPRVPPSAGEQSAQWMRDQVREFVLRYFMRVSSFRAPEAAVESDGVSPDFAGPFSWCPKKQIHRQGFGFSQLYY